jgi:hypothetical protein
MTNTIEALRITVLDGATPPWNAAGGWAWTIGTAIAWFAASLAILSIGERIAKRNGSLSRV